MDFGGEGAEGKGTTTGNPTLLWDVCTICKSKLSASLAPKLLPCLHAACKLCITNNGDRNCKECSACSQFFSPADVTDCFFFENFAPKCGGCEETSLSDWCVQCEEALCSDCVLAHQRVKVTRNHTVVPQTSPTGLAASLRCTSHPQERLKFFCHTCDELTCRDCQLINHRGHSFLLLKEALISQREQLQKMLHRIREKSISMKAALLDLDGRLYSIMKSKNDSMTKLSNLVRNMHLIMALRGRQLTESVQHMYNEEVKSLMSMKTILTGLESRQEHTTAFINKILSTEEQCILLHKKQITKQVKDLLSQNTCLPDTTLQPEIHIQQDLFQIIKRIGAIKAKRVPVSSTEECRNNSKPTSVPNKSDSSHFNTNSAVTLSASATSTKSQRDESASILRKPAQPDQLSCPSVSPQQITSNSQQPKSCTVNPASASSVYSQHVAPQTPQGQTSKSHPAQVHRAFLRSVSQTQPAKPKQISRLLSNPYPMQSSSQPQPPSQSSIPRQGVLKNIVARPALPKTAKSLSAPAQPPPPSGDASNAIASQQNPASSFQQNGPLPVQSCSTTYTFNLQPAQSVVLQSHPGIVSLLGSSNTGQNYTPVQIVNQIPIIPCVPQPIVFLSTQTSVPNAPAVVTVGENVKMWQSQVSCPPQPAAPKLTVPPGGKNYGLTNIVSSQHQLPAAQMPCTSKNSGQSEQATQKPQVELPVQASADSVYERDNSMSGKVVPAAQEEDDNLPTSTVSETDMNKLSVVQEKCLPSAPSPDKTSAALKPVCPSSQHSLSPPQSQDLQKSCSTSKHWSTDLPTSFLQILQSTDKAALVTSDSEHACLSEKILQQKAAPASELEGRSTEGALPKCDLELASSNVKISEHTAAPDNHLEDLSSRDALTTSDSQPVSYPDVQLDGDDDDEETDVSDSELMELNYDKWSKRDPELTKDSNKFLSVSLERLPISLPTPGSPLPQFRLVPYSQADEFMLQEIQEGQLDESSLTIPELPDVSQTQSCSPDCHQPDELQDCAVCLSAGAVIVCAECGRSFHSDCHVPPVLFTLTEEWLCSLCQDVNDDADPFFINRLKEPYLSLQDQRRCEQLLLTLMCDEHGYLLCKPTKPTAGCVELDLIRGRLQGKQSPPYRSAAELVSDLWTLFDVLSANSENKDLLAKLQNSFQERLKIAFGNSLHASLLKPACHKDQKGELENLSSKGNLEFGKAKASNTLKRMREFIASNSAAVAKKPLTESTSKNSPHLHEEES